MTREEAVEWMLFQKEQVIAMSDNKPGTLTVAYDMAIEALQKQEHDGCEGCKYTGKDQYEMPCLMCKQSKKDLWERKEP